MISLSGKDEPLIEVTAGLADAEYDHLQLVFARQFCARIANGELQVAGDLAEHVLPGGEMSPQIGVAACLGIPLRDSTGGLLGAICVIDMLPRGWSNEDRALLTDVAALFENEVDLSTEIERRRAAEESSELITRELSHRIKNIFTVIGSLVSLSVRGHPEARAFANTVSERISALGRANDYVRPDDQARMAHASAQTLLGLIEALMIPYQESDRLRIHLEGEDAPIGKLSVTTLALVLHELATNAVKYGALSSPAGSVTISCRHRGSELLLAWREEGGPKVSGPPTQHGFGTILSQRAATAQLGATVAHDWLPEGLVMRMTIPLRRLAM